MKKILLIEDEAAIAQALQYALEKENFTVQWVSLAHEGVLLARQNRADFIIMDVGLPDMTGFEACKQIRQFSEVPILFLTARDDEIDRILGLEIGGDDYVTKPFSPREIVARVKTVLKRVQKQPAPLADISEPPLSFMFSDELQQILFQGAPIPLTRFEMLIFKQLLSQPKRIFSRELLMDAVGASENSFERSIDTHIKTLRQKLGQYSEAKIITTHRGIGYSYQPLTET